MVSIQIKRINLWEVKVVLLRGLVAHCYEEIFYQKAIEEPDNRTYSEEKGKCERHVFHALGSYYQPLQTGGKFRIRHGWMGGEKRDEFKR